MQGRYKPFDKELFKKNDKLGRKYAKHFLPRILREKDPKKYHSVEVKDNQDVYGPDLCCYNEGELVGYFETEIKHNWVSDKFPFQDLQIPERKAKWIDGHKGLPVTFCVLSKPVGNDSVPSIQNMVTVKGRTMSKCPLQVIPNKFMPHGEKFFKIPIDLVNFHHFPDYSLLYNESKKRKISKAD